MSFDTHIKGNYVATNDAKQLLGMRELDHEIVVDDEMRRNAIVMHVCFNV